MEDIDNLQKQLSECYNKLDKHKKGLKTIILIALTTSVITPIIPRYSRHHNGLHAMTEKLSYPICVVILIFVIGLILLQYDYKQKKKIVKEINLLQHKINKLKE